MEESAKSTNRSAWALLLLGAIGFVLMVLLMMRDTGDHPYQAATEVTLHARPATDSATVETLAAGGVLLCHGPVEADPEWLDCSDMLEKKFARADALQAISEHAYEEVKAAQPASRRD